LLTAPSGCSSRAHASSTADRPCVHCGAAAACLPCTGRRGVVPVHLDPRPAPRIIITGGGLVALVLSCVLRATVPRVVCLAAPSASVWLWCLAALRLLLAVRGPPCQTSTRLVASGAVSVPSLPRACQQTGQRRSTRRQQASKRINGTGRPSRRATLGDSRLAVLGIVQK